MRKILIILLSVFLLINAFCLYVGHDIYDYVLNSHAQETLFDQLQVDETYLEKAHEWLNKNSTDMYIHSYDGLKLHGYYIAGVGHVYMIMVHGYRSDGGSLLSPIKKVKQKKFHIIIPDLRGHGLSEGDYIGMGWDDREDIIEWINTIIEMDQNASIILYGVSMGGATVMNVSGENLPKQVKAIIEDCGYTDIWEVFESYQNIDGIQSSVLSYIANLNTKVRAGYLLWDDKPIHQVQKSQVPILFIHGDQDEIVPFSMLEKLYNVASCPKQKLVIKGAHHADSCRQNPRLYYQTLFDFIDQYT